MRSSVRPKIGLALGGGALRGTAHIGVLRALEAAGLAPDLVCGASMGAMVAGLYACGWSPSRLQKLALGLELPDLYDTHFHPRTLLRMGAKVLFDALRIPSGLLGHPPTGLIGGQRIEALLQRWTGQKPLSACSPPAAFVATDLISGERVVFGTGLDPGPWVSTARNGVRTRHIGASHVPVTTCLEAARVAEAVRASIAIPFVFEPKTIAGRLLVDGGLVDNVPADVAEAMGADVIVAVDLGWRPTADEPAPDDIADVLVRCFDVMAAEITRLRWQVLARRIGGAVGERGGRAMGGPLGERLLVSSPSPGALLLCPRVPPIGLTEFARIPECIAAGEEAAQAALPALRRLLARAG